MTKIEYVNYKGKKLPLSLTMLSLVLYKEAKGENFEENFKKNLSEKESFENFLLLFHLMLTKGAEFKYSILKRLINKLFTGNIYGIRNNKLQYVLDTCFIEFITLIPHFYLLGNEAETINEKKN
jgi:hypothetical protein